VIIVGSVPDEEAKGLFGSRKAQGDQTRARRAPPVLIRKT
jgi:hypothetical protein